MADIENPNVSLEKKQWFMPCLNEKQRIIMNIYILSIAFMVHFTGCFGIENLQSSINAGLGQISLAAIYLGFILSSIFVPVIAIKYLGCKWTVTVMYIMYTPYLSAQFYPTLYTFIPTAFAVGLGGAPLWCAKCTYLAVAAEAYANLTGGTVDVIMVRFFGIFFAIYVCSQIWGNLISSIVLSLNTGNGTSNVGAVQGICGANFCPEHATSETLVTPSADKVNMLTIIYLGCTIGAALIVAFFLDSMSKYHKKKQGSVTKLTGFRLLSVVLKLLRHKNQILILPLTMWLGITNGLLGADFTAGYVTCAIGVSNVGYVLMCYGVLNAISAYIMGWLTKIFGKVVIISVATIIHLGLFIFLLIWIPRGNENEWYIFYLVTGFWGFADGAWYVQINALYGILFPEEEEAAFSNFRLWKSLGYVIAYSYSSYLCMRVKIYLATGLLVVGSVGFIIAERSIPRRIKS